MEIKIIECAMSNAALEEVKRQYGADGLIVSSIATATKNLIILAVENVSMREPQKTQKNSGNSGNSGNPGNPGSSGNCDH